MNTLSNLIGRVSISRSANRGHITIIVRDELSRTKFLEIEMRPEDFALAVTGMGEVPCLMQTRNLERVGLQMQTKIVHIHVGEVTWLPSQLPEGMGERMVEHYEKDGWKANLSGLNNHKRRVENGCQAVTFSRWIATEDIKPCPKP